MLMRLPLTYLPFWFALAIEAQVSVKRVQEFFNLEEANVRAVGTNSAIPVKMENAFFEWDVKEPAKPAEKPSTCCGLIGKKQQAAVADSPSEAPAIGKLQNINMQVKQGELCMIVGKVGSGKSSLLQALLGDMKHVEGDLETSGSIGYCSQQSWIQNATLRDNILFGETLDEERYRAVLDACALSGDLKLFPNADLTEIGEQGIVSSISLS